MKKLTTTEHNIIIAALRLYQAARFDGLKVVPLERVTVEPELAREIEAVADKDDGFLNTHGVDALIEHLQEEPETLARYLYVRCEVSPQGTYGDDGSQMPSFAHRFVDAIDVHDAYTVGGRHFDEHPSEVAREYGYGLLNDYAVEIPGSERAKPAAKPLPPTEEQIMFHYDLSDGDWDALPDRLRQALADSFLPESSPTIYIAVRGGVVQGVRCTVPADCIVVDYDNYAFGSGGFETEESFERDALDGRTWADLEKTSEGVF